jgi:hypothetical protein
MYVCMYVCIYIYVYIKNYICNIDTIKNYIRVANSIIFTAACPMNCSCSKTMTYVMCQRQQLQKVPDNLPSTTLVLLLGYNNISHLTTEDFAGCRKLITLNLYNNCIRFIENNTFADTVNLATLAINRNRIDFGSVHYGLFDALKNLTVLRMDHNRRNRSSGRGYRGDLFRELRSLRELHLDGIPDVIFPEEFSRLKRLKEMKIFNGLTAIHNDTFANFAGSPLKNFLSTHDRIC